MHDASNNLYSVFVNDLPLVGFGHLETDSISIWFPVSPFPISLLIASSAPPEGLAMAVLPLQRL